MYNKYVISIFSASILCYLKHIRAGSRKNAPAKSAPRKVAPRKIAPWLSVILLFFHLAKVLSLSTGETFTDKVAIIHTTTAAVATNKYN